MTGSLPNSERAHTTPLKRDNSRVNQEAAPTPEPPAPDSPNTEKSPPETSTSGTVISGTATSGTATSGTATSNAAAAPEDTGGPGETTRPAFQSPGPPGGRRGVPAAAHPPSNPPLPTPAPASNLPTNQHLPSNPQAVTQQAVNPPAATQQSVNPHPPSTPPWGHPPQNTPRPGGYAPTSQQAPVSPPVQYQGGAPQAFSQQPYSQSRGHESTGSSPMAYLRDAANAATSRHVTPMGWVFRGLGLLAVSLISGLLWLVIKPEGPPTPEAHPGPKTAHQFNRIRWEESTQSCRALADLKIRDFFAKQECTHLTRALYTTELPGGQRVLTSVTTVLMPEENSAKQLEQLATTDNTGNLKDLVDEGRPGLEDSPKLNDKGYAAAMQNRLVVIGDSAYFAKKSPENDPQLVGITNDALQLGWPQDKNQ